MNITGALEFFYQALCLSQLPTLFAIAWSTHDTALVAGLKRVFILLPILSIAVGYWASVASALTVVVRADRQLYLRTLMLIRIVATLMTPSTLSHITFTDI